MNSKDLLYWIWFAEAVGQANGDAIKLLKHYENPYEIFRCEEFEMDLFPGLSENTRALLEKKDLYAASRIVEACEKYQINIITYHDEQYPNVLREIQDPPVLLYYQGTLPDWNKYLSIGIVGTRKMTAYGLHFAYKIAYEMTSADTIVISGMASGIDGVAAAAAIAAKGKTVAILGSGLDCAYPSHHRRLKDLIVKNGAVLSEYPPGTKIKPYHFPIRNRLISGISQGTLVVEAGVGSGSLITARLAKKQGREIYAIPANVGSDVAEGTNELLREGASMILESEDVLERYKYIYAQTLRLEGLMKAKLHSQVDLAYLKSLDVAVFDVTEKSKNGPPYVKIANANIKETVEEQLRRNPSSNGISITQQTSPNLLEKAKPASVDIPMPKQHLGQMPKAISKDTEPVASPKKEVSEKSKNSALLETLSPVQLAILEMIPEDRAISADAFGNLEYPYGEIIAGLTMLEIMGLVEKLPGALYTKI